uniref:Preprotein-translocase subunit g n=1 Tax=Osmundea sinicola TaxID=290685 RepID=A0A7L4WP98_9FLOR|nr:preprotein-translocase subunit g [Osmundea sinicola]QFR99907.1 preprotein-translocase subunit g [Osmundea sinicola]
MIKLTFYLVSILTILLILLVSPSKNGAVSFGEQSKLLNSGYTQIMMQRIIGISVFTFFIFIIILLFQVT